MHLIHTVKHVQNNLLLPFCCTGQEQFSRPDGQVRVPDNKNDSGWRFFSGSENQAYSDDPANLAICALTTIGEIDPDIVGYLDTLAPCAFERAQDDEPISGVPRLPIQA